MSNPSSVEPRAERRAYRLVTLAAVLVGIGLGFGSGHLNPIALCAMTLAMVASLASAWHGRRPPRDDTPSRLDAWLPEPTWVLWIAILASISADLVIKPGDFIDTSKLGLFRPLLVLAGLLASTYRLRSLPPLLERTRFPALLLLAASISGLVVYSAPNPVIDVWQTLHLGAEALLRGDNPYDIVYRSLYAPPSLSDAQAMAHGYPYMPVTLLLSLLPVALLHDVRWLMLALVVVSAWAIRKLGRDSRTGELAAVFFLFQPRAFFFLEQSWSEPVVFGTLLLTLAAVNRWWRLETTGQPGRGWLVAGLAGGLLVGVKQYSLFLFIPLFLALPRRGRVKAAALAVGITTALMLPFFLWDPAVFAYFFVGTQLQDFRPDALSYLAAIVALGGPRLPFGLSFVLAATTLVATLRRGVSLPRATTIGGASLIVLLLFHKLAFCNYYWIAGSVLTVSVALYAARFHPPSGSLHRALGMQNAAGEVLDDTAD